MRRATSSSGDIPATKLPSQAITATKRPRVPRQARQPPIAARGWCRAARRAGPPRPPPPAGAPGCARTCRWAAAPRACRRRRAAARARPRRGRRRRGARPRGRGRGGALRSRLRRHGARTCVSGRPAASLLRGLERPSAHTQSVGGEDEVEGALHLRQQLVQVAPHQLGIPAARRRLPQHCLGEVDAHQLLALRRPQRRVQPGAAAQIEHRREAPARAERAHHRVSLPPVSIRGAPRESLAGRPPALVQGSSPRPRHTARRTLTS